MIWDKYKTRVNSVHKANFNAKEFVNRSIKDFVGTQDQILKKLELQLISHKTLLRMYQQEAIERDEVIAEIDTKRIILIDALKELAQNNVGVGWISKFARETLLKVGEEI